MYIIIGVIVVIIMYVFILFNTFVKYNNKVKEAFSTMDVYLKKRWDLIPSLVETVKGYTKHEKETLESVTRMRNRNYNDMSYERKLKSNEDLTVGLTKLIALAENYPELKASENYRKLSNELVQLENDIAKSRKYYNGAVRYYNNKIEIFPNNIFAKLFGFKSKTMFEATIEERQNINIEM